MQYSQHFTTCHKSQTLENLPHLPLSRKPQTQKNQTNVFLEIKRQFLQLWRSSRLWVNPGQTVFTQMKLLFFSFLLEQIFYFMQILSLLAHLHPDIFSSDFSKNFEVWYFLQMCLESFNWISSTDAAFGYSWHCATCFLQTSRTGQFCFQ